MSIKDDYVLCLCCGKLIVRLSDQKLYCDQCGEKQKDKIIAEWNNLSEEAKNRLLGI